MSSRRDRPRPPDPSVVLVDGPWRHRDVSANGTRLHVAELGDGPLVLLLHGFPQFWWAFRDQLTALAAAGYRAVAPDLRGYGASDKPPRGYDVHTLSDDVAGLIRALGERDAVIVGHDWGGVLGWATAALRPRAVRGLVALSAPHPRRARSALLGDVRHQGRASAYIAYFQLPWRPERALVADDGRYVGQLLRDWGGPGYPDPDAERRYREAIQVPGVAHSSMEYYRWMGRSQLRPDGARFAAAMRAQISAPTLQLHGALDECLLASTAQGSGRYVRGPYTWRLLDGLGHFIHEEAPDTVTAAILDWLPAAG